MTRRHRWSWQTSDNAPAELQEQLFARVSALAGVASGPSQISVPGARGFVLDHADGPDEAFLVPQVGEFAHLHPAYDGSLHLALPPEQAADVVAKGWGTPHMWTGSRLSLGFTMVFGPRDADELEVVAGIVAASHAYASGRPVASPQD
jgi:phospholipase/carboxylesterase